MITWKQLRDALDGILEPDEIIMAVHIASGKTQLEIVRYSESEQIASGGKLWAPIGRWTLIRTPTGIKEKGE